jgi:haloacetate dehalogenase
VLSLQKLIFAGSPLSEVLAIIAQLVESQAEGFDVIPILEAWSRSDARFAQTYWPWILLSQKQPLPESYLLGAPKAVFDNPFGHGSFSGEILEEYVSTYRDAARVHGICEEYRAGND